MLDEYKKVTHATKQNELPSLVERALEKNSRIRMAHDRWLAETHTIPQARALPDPKLTFEYINLKGRNPLEEVLQGLESFGASQEVPFPGKLYMRWKVADISAKEVHASFRAESFKVITSLKQLYYQLYLTDRQLEIYQRNRAELKSMMSLAEKQNHTAGASEQDALMADTEISRIDMKLVMLHQERQSLVAKINDIAERELSTTIHTPKALRVTPFTLGKKELDDLVREKSPELETRRQAMRKGKKEVKLTQMEYFPDIEAEAEKLRDTKLNADGYLVGFTLSVPLYFYDKQNNAVRASVAKYNAALEDYQDIYWDVAYDVRNAYFIIERTNKLIKFTKNSIMPRAEAAFDASKRAYTESKVDFLTYLNNLLILQQTEIDYESELVRHEQRIADIEQAIGMFL